MDKKEDFDSIAKRLIIVSFILYLTVIVLLSIVSQTSFTLVFIGTIPLLLYLVVFFLIYTHKNIEGNIIWILPLVFPVLFYYIWMAGVVPIISKMEGLEVAVMNILFSYALNVFLILVYKIPKQKEKRIVRKEKNLKQEIQKKAEYHRKATEYHQQEKEELKKELEKYKAALEVTKQNFAVNLRSIEDKCKALNFTIGRVYSTKKGGNEKIRGKLKIDKALYNKFSEITSNFDATYARNLLELLEKLWIQFKTLEMTEKEAINKSIHAQNGEERVIDILEYKDKDPAHEYFFEAKEVCDRIMAYLKETYNV